MAVLDSPVGIEINSSQFSVLSSQFSVLSSQFSVLRSQIPYLPVVNMGFYWELGTGNRQLATVFCYTCSFPGRSSRYGRKDAADFRQSHALRSAVSLLRAACIPASAVYRGRPFYMASQSAFGIALRGGHGGGNRDFEDTHVRSKGAGSGDAPGRTHAAALLLPEPL